MEQLQAVSILQADYIDRRVQGMTLYSSLLIRLKNAWVHFLQL